MAQFRLIVSLVAVLALSVSVMPLLPLALQPNLVSLVLVGASIESSVPFMIAWAIWGGLARELLVPGPFGLGWVSVLVTAVILLATRRVVAVADLPLLWPIWFAVGTLLVDVPYAVASERWLAWLGTAVATAGWGTLVLAGRRWIAISRSARSRS